MTIKKKKIAQDGNSYCIDIFFVLFKIVKSIPKTVERVFISSIVSISLSKIMKYKAFVSVEYSHYIEI